MAARTRTDTIADSLQTLVSQPLDSVLERFSAGKAVPGSGSANALVASIAAALVSSVARKTSSSDKLEYLVFRDTSKTIARQADRERHRLLELLDLDAISFAPVVAIRRETGKLSDPILQDAAMRQEIANLRPATEIPQEMAERSIRVAHLASTMFDVGFSEARGESLTALYAAAAAAECCVAIAEINIKRVRSCAAKLNDPGFEAGWLDRMRIRNQELRLQIEEIKTRQVDASLKLERSLAPTKTKGRKTRRK